MITFGVLSTYPPTHCGIATFSAALVKHFNGVGSRSSAAVVRVGGEESGAPPPEVVAELPGGDPGAVAAAAAALNRFDVAVVQHEYGIYGGPEGEEVLDVLERVRVPVIAVLHTVPATPTIWQRNILSQLCHRCDAIVVLSQTAACRLLDVYGVDSRRITVIPHGAETRLWQNPGMLPDSGAGVGDGLGRRAHPLLLTWGLIGPGKGIEWVIDALAAGAGDLPETPRYLVAGETHPKVLRHLGEAYRDGLRARAEALGVARLVEFDAAYRDSRDLAALVASADAVILPYDSTEQVASGVLTEAVAAGKPIIATRFPHAAELLQDGAGLLVPHGDPRALGTAIRRVLTEQGLAEGMRRRAAQLAPTFDWSAIAERYRLLAIRLTGGYGPRTGQPGRPAHGQPRVGRRTGVGYSASRHGQ